MSTFTRKLTALFFLVQPLVVYPTIASSADTYAALAVVPGHGVDYHAYAQSDTVDAASDAAMKACANARCKVVRIYRPGECTYLVLGTFQIFWNETYDETKQKTARDCDTFDEACRVLLESNCSQ